MENAAPGQRDGEKGIANREILKASAVRELDGLPMVGQAAFERDCLSFMVDEWPRRMSAEDLFAQADDLIEVADAAHLPAIRRVVGRIASSEMES
jgi:hypothetical protein